MIEAKPHKEYDEQLEILLSRNMVISNQERAIRKLSQVGYYRLSGFWYPSRLMATKDDGQSYRTDNFLPGTTFEKAYDLYLFDKKLRLLFLDALERIEIHIRSIIAHEVGRNDPLAYRNESYINRSKINFFNQWLIKLDKKIQDSRDDCIIWHKNSEKEIPFWVAIEVWDFGQMSKYYAMLNGGMQQKISRRLGISNTHTLKKWLECLNLIRNRCAHHSRIWNRTHSQLTLIQNDFFNTLAVPDYAKPRIYSAICITWFLVKQIGPASNWIRDMADLIDTKPNLPGCGYDAMGLPRSGFPRSRFGADLGFIVANNEPLHEC